MNSHVVIDQEDHRIRVARVRRERMRAHILNSVMIAYSASEPGSPVVIDDVIRHAGVARGTFYKYFDSLEKAMSELAQNLADEMAGGGIAGVYDPIRDPVTRTAIGFQLYLARAMMEPAWGAFIYRVGLINRNGLLAQKIIADLEAGLMTGDYDLPSISVALDMMIGVKVEALQRIVTGRVERGYIHGMAALTLRALGVAPTKARTVVANAFCHICDQAPAHLEWWNSRESHRLGAIQIGRCPDTSGACC